ncbi:MAG: thioredoxin [Acidobacteriota bacterium]
MSDLIEVRDSDFEAKVLGSQRPVLVDFSASWCGPCKRLEPIVRELATEYAGKVDIVHVDVDEAQKTAARYGVMSVPTLLFFNKGEVRDQLTGLVAKEALAQRIDQLLT